MLEAEAAQGTQQLLAGDCKERQLISCLLETAKSGKESARGEVSTCELPNSGYQLFVCSQRTTMNAHSPSIGWIPALQADLCGEGLSCSRTIGATVARVLASKADTKSAQTARTGLSQTAG